MLDVLPGNGAFLLDPASALLLDLEGFIPLLAPATFMFETRRGDSPSVESPISIVSIAFRLSLAFDFATLSCRVVWNGLVRLLLISGGRAGEEVEGTMTRGSSSSSSSLSWSLSLSLRAVSSLVISPERPDDSLL